MGRLYDRFVEAITDWQMRPPVVQADLAEDIKSFRHDLRRSGSKVSLGTPEDLEDMRAAMKLEREQERRTVNRLGL